MGSYGTAGSGSCGGEEAPPSKRFKPSTEASHDLLLSGIRFGNNARLHQGHLNIETVNKLYLSHPSGLSSSAPGSHIPAECSHSQTECTLKLKSVYEAIRLNTDPEKYRSAREARLPKLQYTKEGFNWLHSHHPSLLLCESSDINSPGVDKEDFLNAFDLSRELRQLSGLPPVQAFVSLDSMILGPVERESKVLWDIYCQIAHEIDERRAELPRYLLDLHPEHCTSLISTSNGDYTRRLSTKHFTQLLDAIGQRCAVVVLQLPPDVPLEAIRSVLYMSGYFPTQLSWKLLVLISPQDLTSATSKTKMWDLKLPIITRETEFEECLRSFVFDGMGEPKRLIQDALPGSNEWIWSNTTFREWREQAGLLWITGPPGSGKSVLCKSILQKFNSRTQESMQVCAWFYSARGLQRGTSHAYMLRAVLHAILSRNQASFEAARNHYRIWFQQSIPRGFWGEADGTVLAEMLRAVAVDKTTQPTVLILDGLDELLINDSDPHNLHEFFELLSSLAFATSTRIWLIACSRPVPEFRSEFLECFHIPIHENNSEDTSILVDHGIDTLRVSWPHRQKKRGGRARYLNPCNQSTTVQPESLSTNDERELERMKKYLTSRSFGSMIWIKLIFSEVDNLIRQKVGFTLAQLREKIQGLPQDLDKLYREILTTLDLDQNPEKCRISEKIFMWVTASPKWGTLQLQELREALAIPDNYQACAEMTSFDKLPMNRYHIAEDWDYFYSILYAHCGVLLEFVPPMHLDNSRSTLVNEMSGEWSVHLVHHTAKLFLETRGQFSPLHIVEPDAIRFVLTQSAWYLTLVFPPGCSRDIFNTLEESSGCNPLHPSPISPVTETLDRAGGIVPLSSCLDISNSVRQRLENLLSRIKTATLLPFTLRLLRNGEVNDTWLAINQLPDFLIWWLKYVPIPYDTIATLAHLSAYLRSPGTKSTLSVLLKFNEIFFKDLPLNHDMLRGLFYKVSEVSPWDVGDILEAHGDSQGSRRPSQTEDIPNTTTIAEGLSIPTRSYQQRSEINSWIDGIPVMGKRLQQDLLYFHAPGIYYPLIFS